MSSSRSSISPVRVFRYFSITNGWRSYREAPEKLQHRLDVTRKRLLQKHLKSGLKLAQNGFWNNPTELSPRRVNSALLGRVGSGLSCLFGSGRAWAVSSGGPMLQVGRVDLSWIRVGSKSEADGSGLTCGSIVNLNRVRVCETQIKPTLTSLLSSLQF